jgi:signal transduction histidine kinase
MPDDVAPWLGPHPDGPAEGSEASASRAAAWPELPELLAELPERFREPARRLAAELSGEYGLPVAWEEAAEPASREPWYATLDSREAWAVAEAFRTSIERWAAGATGHRVPEAHAALDRALLGAALASTQRLSRSNRRMLAEVAHDIRSPMNSVLFLADAIRSERTGPLNEVQRRQVGVLYTASITLVKMVNDVIDFARMQDGEGIRLSMTSFSVESVVSDTRSLLGPLVAHRDVSLDVEIDAEGVRSGDSQLLGRVLLNLATNAVQSVDEGGRVTVRVDETAVGDLRVAVGDDRIGTDVDHLRRLISDVETDSRESSPRAHLRGRSHGIGHRLHRRAAVPSPVGAGRARSGPLSYLQS